MVISFVLLTLSAVVSLTSLSCRIQLDPSSGLPILVLGTKTDLIICCVDRQQPEIHEVWTFGEDGFTPEVHPTARVDVVAVVGD